MGNVTWKSEIIEVLKILGEAKLSDILEKIQERNNIDLTNAKTPIKTISNVLQMYSYSTEYGIEDTFRSVYGVSEKKGIWALSNGGKTLSVNGSIDDEYDEGKEIIRLHKCRERNPRLREKSIRLFKESHKGKLYCEICGFDFFDVYGEVGYDFIEVHHTKPLSRKAKNEKTKICDVSMVCSNCHRMIHRKLPWLSNDDLKRLLEKNKIEKQMQEICNA